MIWYSKTKFNFTLCDKKKAFQRKSIDFEQTQVSRVSSSFPNSKMRLKFRLELHSADDNIFEKNRDVKPELWNKLELW